MKSLILMLQFFTRLPINIQVDVKEDSFTKGIPWFPLVGLVVGCIDAIIFAGIAKVLPVSAAAAFTVLCDVMVTGALHYDGLADTCDGVFSARSRERMLEIMKDSRLGTNGALALCFDIGLKILVLAQVDPGKAAVLVIAMSIISRMMLQVVICLSRDNSKGNGLGSLFLGSINVPAVLLSLAAGSAAAILLLGLSAFAALAVNLLLVLLYRNFIIKRLGVMTGDTMGALNELSVLTTLLVYMILERNVLL